MDAVEFRTFNDSEETVTVERIEVNQIGGIETAGIWAQEPWGRWAEQECSIIYYNQDDLAEVGLYLLIATPAEDGATVTITCGSYSERVVTNGQTEVRSQIPLAKGENEIRLSSSAPNIVAPGDLRNMNIGIYDMFFYLSEIE